MVMQHLISTSLLSTDWT